MSKPTGPQIAQTATWLSIVSQLFTTRMITLLEPHGLTVGQFGILNHIVRAAQNGPSRVSDIANAVEVGQPAVTKALAKFQTLQLVDITASKTDKRSKFVSPRSNAGALLNTIYQDIGPHLAQTFGVLDTDGLDQFTNQLKQLAKSLDSTRL